MTSSFAEVASTFERRAFSIVWATLSSVDRLGRPRTRVVHPVWEGLDAPERATGWLTTYRRGSLERHLRASPYLSVAYLDVACEPWQTVQAYADCRAEWVDAGEDRAHAFELIASLPEPVGFDVTAAWPGVELDEIGLVRLIPWRIEVASLGTETGWGQHVWRR